MSLRGLVFNDLVDVPRTAWDDSVPTLRPTRNWSDISVYEQHHTGGKGPTSLSFEHKRRWILAIERLHRVTKGWRDIFYHVFVFADGETWGGRHPLVTSQGNINTALTVHIPGNNEPVTEVQYQRLLDIARWCTVQPHQVRDHQQRPAATECSGSNGRLTIARLRKDLTAMPTLPTNLVTEDLGTHPHARAAKDLGLWNGVDPARVASRSVAAVTAYRAYAEAVERIKDLERRVAALEASQGVTSGSGLAVDEIVDEIARRLES